MVVLFDLDDTLVDSQRAVGAAVLALHSTLNISAPFEHFMREWRRAHARHYPRYLQGSAPYSEVLRERVRDVVGKELSDREAEEIFASYMTEYEKHWLLFDDVLPCLDKLNDRTLGVISNGPSVEQRRKLSRLGIEERFKTVLISEECGCPKPQAAIFLRACASVGVSPSEAVYVGDQLEVDFLGARAAGLRAIWLNRSGSGERAGETDVVTSLRQVPTLIAPG